MVRQIFLSGSGHRCRSHHLCPKSFCRAEFRVTDGAFSVLEILSPFVKVCREQAKPWNSNSPAHADLGGNPLQEIRKKDGSSSRIQARGLCREVNHILERLSLFTVGQVRDSEHHGVNGLVFLGAKIELARGSSRSEAVLFPRGKREVIVVGRPPPSSVSLRGQNTGNQGHSGFRIVSQFVLRNSA